MKSIILIFTILILILSQQLLAGEIALSFDDAPRGNSEYYTGIERTSILIKKLKELQIPEVVFFCNSDKIWAGHPRKRLEMYANAGHLIANHTHSHPSLNNTAANDFIEDILIAEDSLQQFDTFTKWFRYPYLHQGRTIERRDSVWNALDSMGYQIGYVTIDNYEWYLAKLFQGALKTDQEIDFQKLKDTYIEVLWNSIIFYDNIAKDAIGRSVKHVLLLHENDLAALFIDDLVKHIRTQGWQIISPSMAYQNSIATIRPDVLFNGQGRVAAIAYDKKYKPRNLIHPSEDEAWLDSLFTARKIFK